MCYNPRSHADTLSSLISVAAMGVMISGFVYFGALEGGVGCIVIGGYISLYTALAISQHNKHMKRHARGDRMIEDAADRLRRAEAVARKRD